MTVIIRDSDYKPAEIPEEDKAPSAVVDPNVHAALPPDTRIKLVTAIGASFWAVSKKIEAILADGQHVIYFLKIYSNELGYRMARAEFEGGLAVHAVIPMNSARPIARGTYAENPDKHFLVLEYHDVDDNLPRPTQLVSTLATLHQNSTSPTGKFGFHVEVFGGCQSVDTTWHDSWEFFFTRMFRNALETEISIHGENEELTRLKDAMFEKVIPRLLRPMETNGRSIRPCLLHGDLWHGNVAIDVATDDVFLFDFASFYGHNEYDMAPWRATRYRTDRSHQAAYWKVVKPSPPKKDADDRNALYAVLNDILVSANWPQTKKTRQLAMDGMRLLVEKFPDGYEGYVEEPEQEEGVDWSEAESIDIEFELGKEQSNELDIVNSPVGENGEPQSPKPEREASTMTKGKAPDTIPEIEQVQEQNSIKDGNDRIQDKDDKGGASEHTGSSNPDESVEVDIDSQAVRNATNSQKEQKDSSNGSTEIKDYGKRDRDTNLSPEPKPANVKSSRQTTSMVKRLRMQVDSMARRMFKRSRK